ncbi:actin-related protein 10-like [Saccoglossus kowalevskii]|uniref:Actin-related protein 10-like n=1 Tax=Saccoglossus kowalevskii TaxID=10224 RepID=A0ABM0M6H3_SACKO|nr:PREDICTED: actin-related protein 10-like [Saccoglossus kowalevskii]
MSIATLILESILKCPLDIRRELAENIICVGGTSLLPGFRLRLKAELLDLLNKPTYKNSLPIPTIKFHNPPSVANYTAWLGGAIFGALDVLVHRSVSRDSFLQHGRLPDWSSLDNSILEQDQQPKEKTPIAPLATVSRQFSKGK